MNWSPNMNPGQAPAPNAGQPQGGPPPQQGAGYGAPQPGYGPPQGAPPQGQAGGGYAGPGAGQPQGMPAGTPPRFTPQLPNMNDSEPYVPFGDHVLEATGRVEFVGQASDMLIAEFVVIQTNNAQVSPGTKGCWKRYLGGNAKGRDNMITDAIAKLVVPLSGQKKDAVPPPVAQAMVTEFYNQRTIGGQSIAGKRVGVTVFPNSKGNRNKAGELYPDYIFHTL